MASGLGRQRYQGYRMATAPEIANPTPQPSVFRHATDPIAPNRVVYEPSLQSFTNRDHTNDDGEVGISRPRSGAASPLRHSFDSDLRNYFNRSRQHSLPSDGGGHAHDAHAGASLFEFALNRYGVTLIPIVPPKEKEKRSLTKLFSGSWQRKPSISAASNAQHVQHVEFDPLTGQFQGLPKEWEESLTSGASGERWKALINNPTSPPPAHPSDEESVYHEGMGDSNTLSSTAESFYSNNSRYRKPADRPPSFPSTTTSLCEEFGIDQEALRDLGSQTHSHTPRPLPHTPLLGSF